MNFSQPITNNQKIIPYSENTHAENLKKKRKLNGCTISNSQSDHIKKLSENFLTKECENLSQKRKVFKSPSLAKENFSAIYERLKRTESNLKLSPPHVSNSDEIILESFLKMNSKLQKKKIQNETFLPFLKEIIKKTNQKKIRNEEGDNLFHYLLRNENKEIRWLALDCLSAGVEINCINLKGETGLHIAILKQDEELAQHLISNRALQSADQFGKTPYDIALKYRLYSLAMHLALKDPEFPYENIIDLFCKIVNSESLTNWFETSFEKNELEANAEKIWKSLNAASIRFKNQDLKKIAMLLMKHDILCQSHLDNQYQFLCWLASSMIKRNADEKNDQNFLELMLEKNFLATAIMDGGKWFLSELMQKMQEKKIVLDSSIRKKLESLQENSSYILFQYYFQEFSLTNKLELCPDYFNQMNIHLNQLKSEKFPYIDYLEKLYAKSWELKLAESASFEKTFTALEKGNEFEDLSHYAHTCLLKKLISEKKWESASILQKKYRNKKVPQEISEVPCPTCKKQDPLNILKELAEDEEDSNFFKTEANKFIYNLMMDKLQLPDNDTYMSSHSLFRGPALMETIKCANVKMIELANHLSIKEKIPELEALVAYLNQKALPALNIFGEICSLHETLLNNKEKYGEAMSANITSRLKDLTEGNSLLIPFGTNNHATCLLITKTKDHTYELADLNTGLGIGIEHYRWPDSIKFQTYFVISGIPESSLLNGLNWDLTFQMTIEDNIKIVYACIKDLLCKGGKVQEASKNLEDYEVPQMSGTCTMQVLLAFLRYLIMMIEQISTPFERKAIYKLYKAILFSEIIAALSSKLDPTIQKNLVTIQNKLKADLELAHLAADSKEFDKALAYLLEILIENGENDEAVKIREIKAYTFLSRYAILRKASQKICLNWLNHQKNEPPEELKKQKYLNFALAKYEHYSACKSNVNFTIDEYLKAEKEHDFFSLITDLFKQSQYSKFAFEKVIEIQRTNHLLVKRMLEACKFSPMLEKSILKENFAV